MCASPPACCGMAGRKMIKAAAVLIAVGYCSLLVYQGGVAFAFTEPRVHVTDLTIDPVTKTSTNQSETTKNITLDDLFISVKTTRHYQYTRLPIILKTWFQLAKKQIWFFTDIDNPQHQNQTNGHMVNTNCPTTHDTASLCCKMGVEFDYFLESDKKWFCHFDDDNYVNVPRLLSVLQGYDHKEDWYLGRTSVHKPLVYRKKGNKIVFSFWFATGGAGLCLSRSMALKLLPVASGGKFISICKSIRFPDDVSLGFMIHAIGSELTEVPGFHSHYEQMRLLDTDHFKDQISFSYVKGKTEWNVVNVPGFDTQYDPTRFLSLHCFLFPHFPFCPR